MGAEAYIVGTPVRVRPNSSFIETMLGNGGQTVDSPVRTRVRKASCCGKNSPTSSGLEEARTFCCRLAMKYETKSCEERPGLSSWVRLLLSAASDGRFSVVASADSSIGCEAASISAKI